jgi:hypothetical protein
VAPARHLLPTEPTSRRPLRRLLPVAAATLVTGAVVALGLTHGASPDDRARGTLASAPASTAVQTVTPTAAPGTGSSGSTPEVLRDRNRSFSRSAKRVTIHRLPAVADQKYRTARLNLWPAPRERGRPLAVLPAGGRVQVTGVRRAGFAQIVLGGRVRWVTAAYLADKMPRPPKQRSTGGSSAGSSGSTGRSGSSSTGSTGSSTGAATSGLSSAPCADGSGTESGLTSSAVRLFRAACAAFPALSSYGGYDAHGEHSSGKAIDFMTSDAGLGQALADWARAHASELDLFDVIWSQHIWTPVRSGEGWRAMPDRGSPTANHYDHVHISVN